MTIEEKTQVAIERLKNILSVISTVKEVRK